jgi:hypothetical protein
MSGRPSGEEALERWRSVWRLRKQGYGQHATARILKIRLASVQHYLRKGEPPKPARMVLTRHHVPLGQAPARAGDQLLTKGARGALADSWSSRGGTKASSRSRPRVAPVIDLDSRRRQSG